MGNSAIFLAVPISDSASIIAVALATTVSRSSQELVSSPHAETHMLTPPPQLRSSLFYVLKLGGATGSEHCGGGRKLGFTLMIVCWDDSCYRPLLLMQSPTERGCLERSHACKNQFVIVCMCLLVQPSCVTVPPLSLLHRFSKISRNRGGRCVLWVNPS